MPPARFVSERTRVLVCGGLGAAAAGVAFWVSPWQVSLLVGWLVTAVLFLGSVWRTIAPMDAAETARLSTREDNSRAISRALLLGSSVVSLVTVGFAVAKGARVSGALETTLTVLSVATVTLSWAVVHTVFTLRYAHLYYIGPDGGVRFAGDERPDYRDFAYLAFTVGMTFQVSDTVVDSRLIRRVVLQHALLSYLFGTAIVAMTINIVAGLAR